MSDDIELPARLDLLKPKLVVVRAWGVDVTDDVLGWYELSSARVIAQQQESDRIVCRTTTTYPDGSITVTYHREEI